MFITNAGLPTWAAPVTKAVPEKRVDVILNGQLLPTGQTYGFTTQATRSPAPLQMALGVEALSSPTEATRREANSAARAELRAAQPDLEVLARYSGGGGIGESADEFYTPAQVADVMWLLSGVKEDGGSVFDPACGTGQLLARAPRGLHLVGCEISSDSTAIARHLLPHADVRTMPFELFHRTCADDLYTAAVVNPPYGPRTMRHLDASTIRFNETYFILKALERVQHHTGVVVALVNANLTYGDSHQAWREDVELAGLVQQVTLVPTGAFRASGAGVTTAIVVVRRHDLGVREALATLTGSQRQAVLAEFGHLHEWAKGRAVILRTVTGDAVTYQMAHPYGESFRLGRTKDLVTGRYGQAAYPGPVDASADRVTALQQAGSAIRKSTGVPLGQLLECVRVKLGEEAFERASSASREASATPIPLGTRNPEGTWVFTVNGWAPTDDFSVPSVADALFMSTAIGRALELAGQSGVDGTALTHARLLVQRLDAAYRARHGAYDVARLSRLAGRFSRLSLLIANLKAGEVVLPGGDVTPQLTVQGDLAQVARALADQLLLTAANLAEHAGVTRPEALAHLSAHYAFNGEVWIDPGVYYVGNAITMSEHARQLAAQFAGVERTALLKQAEEFLRRMSPAALSDVQLSPRDRVVPAAVLEHWVNAFLNSYHTGGGEQQHALTVVREGGAVKFRLRSTQDTRLNLQARKTFDERAAKDLQAYLNYNTRLPAIAGAADMTPEQYRAERAAAMDEAREYEERVATHFQLWLPASGFAEVTLQAYNLARRSHLTPDGVTAPLDLPDWAGPVPHPYQAMDVRSMAAATGMINGYDVGLGKTFTALMLIAYLRRLGRAVRPLVVVPAGLIGNWATNAAHALPGWRVVTVGMSQVFNADGTPKVKLRRDGSVMVDSRGQPIPVWREDSTATRRLKLGQVTAGDVDLTIMSREAFTAIPMTTANRDRFIQTDEQYLARLEAKDTFDPKGRRSRQDVLKRIQAFQAKCTGRLKTAGEHDLLLEHLSVDLIAYDEAHGYKNVYSASSCFGESVKFLGAGSEADRALDAVYKGRYVRERGGRTYAFTASWVKNSAIEIHSMISLISDDLPEYGLATNEALMEQYLRIEPRIITNMDSSVDVRPAVVGFRRLRELKGIIASKVIVRKAGQPDVVTRTGEPLHVPRVQPVEVAFDMSPEQAAVYADLRQQARMASSSKQREDHAFSVMWRMRKLTADPALLNVAGPNPRFDAIAREVLKVRAQGGKSLVFLSIGEQEGSYERLRDTLIAAGYPAHEIAIVTGSSHSGAVAKIDLEDDYNYGDLTLLICSEVVAEGFNLQIGTAAIVHADIPWNWEAVKQRNGRGGRQGNQFDHVLCIYMLMRGSFDSITYTSMRGKKAWQDQLDGVTDEAENAAAELGTEDLALLLSEDPDATRAAIQAKKEELAERTGQAAFRRKCQLLAQVTYARRSLKALIAHANKRKNGWTAFDHFRVTGARRNHERLAATLSTYSAEDFPLARLATYKGALEWMYGLPFHAGLHFTLGERALTVTSLTVNAVTATDEVGNAVTLTPREIVRGGGTSPPMRRCSGSRSPTPSPPDSRKSPCTSRRTCRSRCSTAGPRTPSRPRRTSSRRACTTDWSRASPA
ncbi:N-6 DNA methylase [Deinococcus soli (ex Cha et al. 2016)]|uniref:N-6 DNA methylase n=2 Tax=Deinococcus soli (ex Cha et al. 2016) TaxID=1309411 RepID=UPI0036D229C7